MTYVDKEARIFWQKNRLSQMIIRFDNPIVKGADTKSNLRKAVTLKVFASRTYLLTVLENPAVTYLIWQ